MWIDIERYGIHVYILYNKIENIEKVVVPYFKCSIIKNDMLSDTKCWKISFDYSTVYGNFKRIIPFIKGDKEPKRMYYVDSERKVIVIEKPDSIEFKVQIAIRLARDIIKHILMKDGYCFLHGGMVEFQGKGVCFLGNKMHGKTSLLLSLLATGKAQYVTNDDVTIYDNNGNIEGVGWPRAVSVRKESIEGMSNILGEYNFNNNLTHPDNFINELQSSYFYYVNELTGIFNSSICVECEVDFFLILNFTDGSFSARQVREADRTMFLQNYVDNEVSRYFMDFVPYFCNCHNELNKPLLDLIRLTPMYYINQNIYCMGEIQDWLERITK